MKTSPLPPAWPDASELLGRAEELLEAAARAGAQQAEAYTEVTAGVSLESCRRTPTGIRSRRSRGVGLRLVKDGRLGYAFASAPRNGHDPRQLVQAAVDNSSINAQDGCNTLPALEGAIYPELRLTALDFANYSTEAKLDLLERAASSVRRADADGTRLAAAAYRDQARSVVIASSSGAKGAYQSTYASLRLEAADVEEGDGTLVASSAAARTPAALQPEAVGSECLERARSLKARRARAQTGVNAVLGPIASAQVLRQVARLLNADTVLRGRSLYGDALGMQVAASVLTLVDDPLALDGLAARPFDAEGVPSSRLELVREGQLLGFLHNQYTANRTGVASTGHARRSSYRCPPDVGPSNFFLVAGSDSPADLMREAGHGLYVDHFQGLDGVTAAGRFSAAIRGYRIVEGRLGEAVRAATTGNLQDLLRGVRRVGNDLRFIQGLPAVGSPSLLLEGLEVGEP